MVLDEHAYAPSQERNHDQRDVGPVTRRTESRRNLEDCLLGGARPLRKPQKYIASDRPTHIELTYPSLTHPYLYLTPCLTMTPK